jgi:hypothetical protein
MSAPLPVPSRSIHGKGNDAKDLPAAGAMKNAAGAFKQAIAADAKYAEAHSGRVS